MTPSGRVCCLQTAHIWRQRRVGVCPPGRICTPAPSGRRRPRLPGVKISRSKCVASAQARLPRERPPTCAGGAPRGAHRPATRAAAWRGPRTPEGRHSMSAPRPPRKTCPHWMQSDAAWPGGRSTAPCGQEAGGRWRGCSGAGASAPPACAGQGGRGPVRSCNDGAWPPGGGREACGGMSLRFAKCMGTQAPAGDRSAGELLIPRCNVQEHLGGESVRRRVLGAPVHP